MNKRPYTVWNDDMRATLKMLGDKKKTERIRWKQIANFINSKYGTMINENTCQVIYQQCKKCA